MAGVVGRSTSSATRRSGGAAAAASNDSQADHGVKVLFDASSTLLSQIRCSAQCQEVCTPLTGCRLSTRERRDRTIVPHDVESTKTETSLEALDGWRVPIELGGQVG